jgi:CHAT domain-containing protein/predicted negative regulator of RcsB-dependent stress response
MFAGRWRWRCLLSLWHDSGILAIPFLAAMTLAGCRSPAVADPKPVYQSIHSDFLRGNLAGAQQNAEKAVEAFSPSDANWAIRFRLLDAEILSNQGRRPEAIALLNDPGVTYPTSGDLAIKRDLLCGLAYATLGQDEQSDAELRKAQHLSDASNSELNGEVLQTEAIIQIRRNHLPEAADLARRSLQVAQEQRDSYLEASDLLNLGRVDFQMRHYDEALTFLDAAAHLARPIQARLIIEAASGNLGLAYFHLGDFEKALSSFRQAEKEAEDMGTTSMQVDWLMDACESHYMLGNLQEAKACFDQSLKVATGIDAHAEVADIQSGLAFLLYRQGQLDSAKAHNEEAIQASRRVGDKAEELKTQFMEALLATHQENDRNPERLLLQASHDSAADPALQGEIEGAIADFYAGKQQATKADLWYRKSIRSFEQQRAAVEDEELRLPFFANGDALYRRYADFLIASRKPEEALQLLDISRARTLAEGLGLDRPITRSEPPGDAQAAASRLNCTILFYSLGPKKSWLWAITPHHTHLLSLPAQSEIETQVHSYQNAILKSTDPLREENQAAKNLYETLVAPAASMIPKGSKVLIIPDGVLNGLNFETLLTPGSGRSHYWIEDVTIRNANSIRMLSGVNPDASPNNTKKLLLIGNPIVTGTGYDNLVNAFAEIRDIEKHFPPDSRTVITQSGAVPASYLESKPEEFSYIHFVAHGTASRLDPLDSAVVLSPSPDNPDNFKLYARDIMRDPLHARLVTISSCYGSGLRAYAGEGLVGLSWAFLRAGAHNVIGALWEVNDASTPLLMDRLYAGLEAGSTPDDALRAAKLSLIHSPAVYRKPLYWAGFQLYTGS